MANKPNFLIGSGVSSGSSFITASIKQHPDIYLPVKQRPEPNFFHFNDRYNKGINWYLETWFGDVTSQRAIGERSSLYLPSQIAAERIRKHFPTIKLIFCLRNPLARAWGNYRFTVLEGLESLSFEEAINTEDDRMQKEAGIWAEVQPHCYVKRGLYDVFLKKYYELFPKENILLIKAENMSKDPIVEFRKVFNFLQVDADFVPKIVKDYSAPSVIDPRVQVECRNYFGNKFPEIIEAIRREEDLTGILENVQDHQMLQRLKNNLVDQKEQIPSACKKILFGKYEASFARLADMVPFDISDWRAS